MSNKVVCFIILHYNTMEETEKCVDSIRAMDEAEMSRIVIVDNASPNNTGKLLEEKYKTDDKIAVLLRENNDGFSVGNNAGGIYAKEKWNPCFFVVANNDIEFYQKDFIRKIWEEYEKNPFAVMGPDIYVPARKIHQSPIAEMPPDKKRVNITICLNQLMLFLYPFVYPVMRNYFRRMETGGQAEKYQIYQENVCLMGACLIYSKEYMDARDKIFEPETRFYYEEYIQMLWCMRHKKKVIYQPKLSVYHMEGKATGTVDAQERKRIRFRMQNILHAAKIYKRFLLETEYEEKISSDQHRL